VSPNPRRPGVRKNRRRPAGTPARRKPRNLVEVVKEAARLALDKKAEGIMIFDLQKLTDATDYFVMVSGDSETQVRAIADHVTEQMAARARLKPWHVEGYAHGSWILLDYIDFVLHIFEKDTRAYYQLERLWGDAEVVAWEAGGGIGERGETRTERGGTKE